MPLLERRTYLASSRKNHSWSKCRKREDTKRRRRYINAYTTKQWRYLIGAMMWCMLAAAASVRNSLARILYLDVRLFVFSETEQIQ